jgi:hypothetical protein
MIKPSFDIVPANISETEWAQSVLVLEVSPNFLGCVWYNQQSQKLLAVKHYTLEVIGDKSCFDLLAEIIEEDQRLNHPVNRVVMVYNFAESSLVPENHFEAVLNRPMLELVYGDAEKALVLSEKIDVLPLYNVYRIPPEIHRLFQQRYSSPSYWHYYTLQLSYFQVEFDSPPQMLRMRIVFYADKMVLAAFKEGDLLILQTFTYQTPEDVTYYLLSVLRAHETDPEDVVLKIAGLVDEDSILYAELLKYFEHVVWDALPDGIDPAGVLAEYPRHYFSPLVRMALCV